MIADCLRSSNETCITGPNYVKNSDAAKMVNFSYGMFFTKMEYYLVGTVVISSGLIFGDFFSGGVFNIIGS